MWQLKQLEKLREIEPDVVDGAIQMFLEKEIVLKEKLIIGAYLDGDINFGKTAELLNIHPVKLREFFLSRGIPIKIGVSSEEEIQAEGFSAQKMQDNVQ
jgi:predicted HTH domain antitoxin